MHGIFLVACQPIWLYACPSNHWNSSQLASYVMHGKERELALLLKKKAGHPLGHTLADRLLRTKPCSELQADRVRRDARTNMQLLAGWFGCQMR